MDGVSLIVRPGEVVGVLGESGSGKSTLAQAILRLLPPGGRIDRGTISFRGRNLLFQTDSEIAKIRGAELSLIFQEPSLALHPTMQVGGQVAAVINAHERMSARERRERVREVLAEVFADDVERILSSYPHQLSGGQRQRVLIAQAIACHPALLIADEPTASLDSTTQAEILALFAKLRRRLGLAIVLITHNPALLAGFADRVLVLYAGRVAEQGPGRSVLDSPLHPYSHGLLHSMPVLSDRTVSRRKKMLPAIPGNLPLAALPADACCFEPRCKDRMPQCARVNPSGVRVTHEHVVHCLKYTD
ncbi:MAG TPA: ABC transporter ATP-binding protein [Candidatus Acidoferrales bacterium]|nr:ABC transporter ATP-binding protein [Candidatus Acidoferrales bacterium]